MGPASSGFLFPKESRSGLKADSQGWRQPAATSISQVPTLPVPSASSGQTHLLMGIPSICLGIVASTVQPQPSGSCQGLPSLLPFSIPPSFQVWLKVLAPGVGVGLCQAACLSSSCSEVLQAFLSVTLCTHGLYSCASVGLSFESRTGW